MDPEVLEALANEITTDPLFLGYPGSLPATIADILNARIPDQGPIPLGMTIFYLIMAGRWTAIKESTDTRIMELLALAQPLGMTGTSLIPAGNMQDVLDQLINMLMVSIEDVHPIMARGQTASETNPTRLSQVAPSLETITAEMVEEVLAYSPEAMMMSNGTASSFLKKQK